MEKIKINVVILFIIFSHSLGAASYKLKSRTFDLPIDKSWLTKKSKTDSKSNLVFFEPNTPNPRIVLSLYRSLFRFPLRKTAEYEDKFKKSKSNFIKKLNAKIDSPLKYSLDDKSLLLRYSLSYTNAQGSFSEYGISQECSSEGYNFKAIVPKGKKLEKSLETFFESASLCSSK